MDIQDTTPSFDPALIDKILSRKCPTHPKELCNLLHLSPISKQAMICNLCKETQKIADSEVIHIHTVIQSPPWNYLPMLSVFTDSNIAKEVQRISSQFEEMRDKIDLYYEELLSILQQSINHSKETEKKNLSDSVQSYIKNIESIKQQKGQMADVLEIVMSNSNDDLINKNLQELFQQALKNSKDNEIVFHNNISQFNHLNEQLLKNPFLEIKTQIQKLIQTTTIKIQERKFGDDNLLDKIEILPYSERSKTGQVVEYEKHSNSSSTYLLTNKTCAYAEFYINYQLKQSQKYILRIQLLQNSGNNQPFFTIVLLNHLKEKLQFIFVSELSYCEIYGGHMSKVLKGSELWSGDKNIGKEKQIEFRFHLQDKIMKAASYPDFKNVAGHHNPSIIDEKGQYYIGFSITYATDSIRILEFKSVEEFDNKMD